MLQVRPRFGKTGASTRSLGNTEYIKEGQAGSDIVP